MCFVLKLIFVKAQTPRRKAGVGNGVHRQQIFVKTPSGKSILLEVWASQSVEDVKSKVQSKTNVPADEQRLMDRQAARGRPHARRLQRHAREHTALALRYAVARKLRKDLKQNVYNLSFSHTSRDSASSAPRAGPATRAAQSTSGTPSNPTSPVSSWPRDSGSAVNARQQLRFSVVSTERMAQRLGVHELGKKKDNFFDNKA